jgi:L-fuculose-phosphate aldolase
VKDAVVAACRRLASHGLVLGSAGNVSARDRDRVAITATGARLERLTSEEVTIVDLDGGVVDGDLAPTSELQLHLGVYRRFDAGAVVHTHAPIATALSCVLDELPCVHYQLLQLGGPVRVAQYRTFGTSELAEATLAALEGRTAALMSNHGTINYGETLDAAIDGALLLEWACSVYWRAAAIGTPRTLDARQQEEVIAATTERAYGPTKRLER